MLNINPKNRIRKIAKKVVSSAGNICFLGLFLSQIAFGMEATDDILDFLPTILAASQKPCNADNLSYCRNIDICESANGHWYLQKCHTTPPSENLLLALKLVGSWTFFDRYVSTNGSEYITDHFYTFNVQLLSSGEPLITGTETICGVDHDIEVIINNPTEILFWRDFVSCVTEDGIIGDLWSANWRMKFVNDTRMTGEYAFFSGNIFDILRMEGEYKEEAWAVKHSP